MTAASAFERAARVWRHRRRSELEAAQRFRLLSAELRALAAPSQVVELAERAAADEVRHAALCAELVRHFGGVVNEEPLAQLRRAAPRALGRGERTLYEVVAMSCVTETLSTALLGALVEKASDSFAKRTMQTILRDEVVHSRLGWAYLAEQHDRGARDCVGEHLPGMLEATFRTDLFKPRVDVDPLAEELSGLGCLDDEASRRVVSETLSFVVFPGLARFGVDVAAGKRWLAAHQARFARAGGT